MDAIEGASVRRAVLDPLITQTIAPMLGEALARASIRAHVQRLGLSDDTVDAAGVTALLEGIEKGLRVFVGSERAARLVATIRAGLAREATR
jgi:cystathionine beta-lyase/cystathionine gamma-synthase